jgi:shikimate kinase
LDKYIEEKNNIKLSDFIEKNGWENFREEENICLKEILKGKQNITHHPSGASLENGSKGKIISL